MFWKMCGSRREGRLADPVGALGAHLGHRERARDRAARPPCRDSRCRRARSSPRARPSSVLCGQPEQKLGRRISPAARRAGGRRERAARSAAASSGARHSSQRRSSSRHEPGRELALRRHQRRAALVALAEQPRALLAVVEQRARADPRSPAASLRRRARPRGPSQKRSAPCGLERPGHRHLVDREARPLRRAPRRRRARRAPGARRGRPCPWSRCRGAGAAPPSTTRSRPFARTNACAAGSRCW